jgi:hypothetical protein
VGIGGGPESAGVLIAEVARLSMVRAILQSDWRAGFQNPLNEDFERSAAIDVAVRHKRRGWAMVLAVGSAVNSAPPIDGDRSSGIESCWPRNEDAGKGTHS